MSGDDLFDVPDDESMSASLGPLKNNCKEAINLQEQIIQTEGLLKSMKARLLVLRTKTIPDMMSEAGVGDIFSTDDGWTIKIFQKVFGGLPEKDDSVIDDGPDLRVVAFQEIIRLGGQNLIKEKIAIAFDKGEYEKAVTVKAAIDSLGYGEVEIDETIHASSYKAFIREAYNKGKELDLKKLNVEILPEAKLTPPKG